MLKKAGHKRTLLAPRHTVPKSIITYRNSFIVKQCHNKHVLHIGCADWPHTEELFNTGLLLHQELENVCATLAGVDISREGIEILQNRGIKNLFDADVLKIKEIIKSFQWQPEIIVMGEVLEHIDMPGQFLREIVLQMPKGCMLLITVPNAFSFKGLLHILLGHEKVNSDHVCYYSYTTMKQLLSRCNLELVRIFFYRAPSNNSIDRILDVLLKPLLLIRPCLSDGLIFSCRRKDSTLH